MNGHQEENQDYQKTRRAAFNLMEDAVRSRQLAETADLEMHNEIGASPRTEGPFRESERSFREMINALPTAIYATDAEGRLTYFNPAAVEFSGRVPELGTDQWCVTLKLYRPDGRPLPYDDCPMASALKEGRTVHRAEAIAERPDGTRVWFAPYSTPLRDAEGNIVGGLNMLVDITERRRAEEVLRRSERDLSDFFDNASVSLHWVGPDGVILRVNQAELDLLGYSREEYLGRHISEFHADSSAIQDILTRLTRGEALTEYPARLRCKDGSIRDVLINSNVLFEAGQFIHTRCFTRDVTDQKQAEEALRRSHAELRAQAEELARFNRTMVGRELRMIELKKEVNELCERQGLPVRYLRGSEQNDNTTLSEPFNGDLEIELE